MDYMNDRDENKQSQKEIRDVQAPERLQMLLITTRWLAARAMGVGARGEALLSLHLNGE